MKKPLVEKTNQTKKTVIVSLVIVFSISIINIVVSTVVSAIYVNSNFQTWKEEIFSGFYNETDWDNFYNKINKYSSVKLAKPFIENYDDYYTIKENRYFMEEINSLYFKSRSKGLNKSEIEHLENIDLPENAERDPVLKSYYNNYLYLYKKYVQKAFD